MAIDQLYIHDHDEPDHIGDMRQELLEKIQSNYFMQRDIKFMGHASAEDFVESLTDEHVDFWHQKWCRQ